jgi:hypothetical protein
LEIASPSTQYAGTSRRAILPLHILAIALLAPCLLGAQSFQANSLLPDWLPTELPAGAAYAGSRRCIECHPAQAPALKTPMGDALQRPRQSEFLRGHERLTFENGPYRYEISRTPQGSLYTVTDGSATITTPLLWSLGHGKAGQTYVFERDGHFYESRVSYYLDIDGLDQTLGAPPGSVPRNLDEASGRRMTPDDVRGCFGCHSTGAIRAHQTDLESLTPGVQCEGCHGPGTSHIAAVEKAQFEDLKIQSLKNMAAEAQSDFCGSCHRTWSQVVLMDLQGPANVRFQPYRIANSRCYDTQDPRIRCAACHDPHQEVVTEAKAYDGKCLACHAPGATSGLQATDSQHAPGCPVGTEKCSECHMPRVEIPGSHFRFADHHIRRPGGPYPN